MLHHKQQWRGKRAENLRVSGHDAPRQLTVGPPPPTTLHAFCSLRLFFSRFRLLRRGENGAGEPPNGKLELGFMDSENILLNKMIGHILLWYRRRRITARLLLI